MNIRKISIVSFLVSALALLIMILTLNEIGLPLLSDYKSAFIVLWIIGFSMSVLAGIRDNPDGEFTISRPVMIPLMILGFLTVPLLILVLFDVPFPFLTLKRERFIALSLIIIAKWILVHVHNFVDNTDYFPHVKN